jgi:hypothetical protein
MCLIFYYNSFRCVYFFKQIVRSDITTCYMFQLLSTISMHFSLQILSSSSSCSGRIRFDSCSLYPQNEIGPSIFSSVVLCVFVLLVYIVVLVSILCMYCRHFSWYCFISSTIFSAPVFSLIHWFLEIYKNKNVTGTYKFFISEISLIYEFYVLLTLNLDIIV